MTPTHIIQEIHRHKSISGIYAKLTHTPTLVFEQGYFCHFFAWKSEIIRAENKLLAGNTSPSSRHVSRNTDVHRRSVMCEYLI